MQNGRRSGSTLGVTTDARAAISIECWCIKVPLMAHP
jgi:hypothetical protein